MFDHGLLYGDGVFEGIRVYDGRVFELDAHIDRLYDSAQTIALAIPLSTEADGRGHAGDRAAQRARRRVRPVGGHAGRGRPGLNPTKCPKATVFIIAATIQLYPEEVYRRASSCVTLRHAAQRAPRPSTRRSRASTT